VLTMTKMTTMTMVMAMMMVMLCEQPLAWLWRAQQVVNVAGTRPYRLSMVMMTLMVRFSFCARCFFLRAVVQTRLVVQRRRVPSRALTLTCTVTCRNLLPP